uniref:Diphthine--ammonia ligase n=1 Tax=Globodera rostochiensis TaxID=31243 RepID=A0A914I3C1_GLORO
MEDICNPLDFRDMKVVGLISGGKDSCFNMMRCVEEGHELVCVANLHPPTDVSELDSYMYQSVGCEGIKFFAEALGLPLFQRQICGHPKSIESNAYVRDDEDEVEDLYHLLKTIKEWDPEIRGVSAGAINSTYQKLRVEDDQLELLDAMIAAGVKAVLIKVAALGLATRHLGQTLEQMREHLLAMHAKYGLHICGEGGEYETFVLDCPLFKRHRIAMDSASTEIHFNGAQNDDICPVAYLKLGKLALVDKDDGPMR